MAEITSQPNRLRVVESSANPLIKVFRRALAEGTTRDGWLAVEGPLLVEEALRAGERATVQSVLISEEGVRRSQPLLERLPKACEVTQTPDRLFRQIAQTETPQGIAALVELRTTNLEAVLGARDALLLVACGLQDPGNLGTILRSAQAFGASALITLAATVSPFNPKAARASAGAVFHVPMLMGERPESLFKRLRAAGVRIVGTDRHSSVRIDDADLRGPLAVLIGQEAAGLPAEIARQAEMLVSIPIRAGMDSLNAATAASIVLYEVARQREFRY
ncbi:MAG: RNA methyltransferase [Terriglobia bacterium]|jgi:TrmH family RNA methyltransferase